MTGYIRALTTLLWLLWPLCTFAASVTLGTTIGAVPAGAWATVLVLSAVSGLLALLQRMNQAMQLEAEIKVLQEAGQKQEELQKRLELSAIELPAGWRLFVTWHMVGSIVMGALAFLFLEASDVNDFIESVLIALSSYAGARMVDRTSSRLMKRTLDMVQKE